MKRNDLGQVIMSEKEFVEIVGTELKNVEELIHIYGEDVTLGELYETLKEQEELI